MEEKLRELKNACEYLVQQYASINISLNYTPESVKELDRLFNDEFKDGEPINPDSAFAKRQGIIMTGVAAYLAEVFLKNSVNSKMEIDTGDKSWYVNFQVISANGWSVEPGQRVIKRKLEGEESNFYDYVVVMLQYFNQTEKDKSKSNTKASETQINKGSILENKKPWWKFW